MRQKIYYSKNYKMFNFNNFALTKKFKLKSEKKNILVPLKLDLCNK